MNSDHPSRMSRSIPPDDGDGAGRARMLSSGAMVNVTPAPHTVRAQPGPMAATTSPATAAPLICAADRLLCGVLGAGA